MCIAIKYFYPDTPMERAEYMWVPISMLPDKVMWKYQIDNIVVNGRVFTHITRSMHGPPQAVRIEYNKIVKHLEPFGYNTVKCTPGLWKH